MITMLRHYNNVMFYGVMYSDENVYTARKAQVAASKSTITKPLSGCVRIACSVLMITSLLQIVNRLAASCELHAGLI